MTRILFQIVVFAFVGLAAFSAVSAQCNPNVESPIRCGYYNAGYRSGEDDARENRSNNYRRYRNQYNRQYESAFRDGYTLGYSSAGGGGMRWTNSQRTAYDAGYNIGQSDRRQGGFERSQANQRGYDSAIALYFEKGYDDGFNNRKRTYNVPVGSNPNPDPWPPTGGGTTGSATWEGSVDDRANVIIRGSRLYTENVTGNGITTRNQRVNGILPRQATVQVRLRDGRGNANVIQQPSRSNNFSAVIQIYDSKSGRDNYRLDISWVGSNVEEQYSSGRVYWRGRVDQTVDLIISGDRVESRDVAGTGLSVISSNLTGYLAARPGNVNARKRDGRGQVSVIQQPSRNNGYTAIVRIFDASGGADNYNIEVDW